VDDQGRLIEDWGTVDVRLQGEGLAASEVQVAATTLEEVVPAVCAVSQCGPVEMKRTIYRAPVFPVGVDVLRVELTQNTGRSLDLVLCVDTSTGVQLGQRTARVGGRTVLVLPRDVVDAQPLLDWGYSDEAVSLPGWARPAVPCDAAFGNIRAGMGGVPIGYRFTVPAGSTASVALGLCESHHNSAGQRPLRCRVEGAAEQAVDPVAKWGQHQPGLLLFDARDENGDGQLAVSVLPGAHALDKNTILNAIWIFAAGQQPAAEQVMAGRGNDAAMYYVDVGGTQDQSIHPAAKLEFPLQLAAGDTQELTFLVACPGATVPLPGQSDWSPATLLRAARDVWRDWPGTRP
jgi:hypothetical protein